MMRFCVSTAAKMMASGMVTEVTSTRMSTVFWNAWMKFGSTNSFRKFESPTKVCSSE